MVHKTYLLGRIEQLGNDFTLRVLLVLVDDKNETPLQELNQLAVRHHYTLVLAWNEAEAARYLETFKAYVGKQADAIKGKVKDDCLSRLGDALQSVRPVNSTDVLTLVTNFNTFQGICSASVEDLLQCAGLGSRKAKALHAALHEPFKPRAKMVAELDLGEFGGSDPGSDVEDGDF
ncbi:unnamed protein product [Chrysoparadoxa australica]